MILYTNNCVAHGIPQYSGLPRAVRCVILSYYISNKFGVCYFMVVCVIDINGSKNILFKINYSLGFGDINCDHFSFFFFSKINNMADWLTNSAVTLNDLLFVLLFCCLGFGLWRISTRDKAIWFLRIIHLPAELIYITSTNINCTA